LGLNKVINSCDRGGQVDEARWLFTWDFALSPPPLEPFLLLLIDLGDFSSADPTDGIIC
jgi:hypothetical protein